MVLFGKGEVLLPMRVALVHDYIREFGGAERVLKTLTEIYPKAPIYTSFSVKNSTAEKEFRGTRIIESFLAPILKLGKLYSPLRFMTPLVWGGFDLSKYDLVISSCSWYITRGFKINPKTKVIAYCHTPPRWLYGYEASVFFTKYWPIRVYSAVVGHFIRMYDFNTAQKPKRKFKIQDRKTKIQAGVDYFIANSKNVAARIKKFYRRNSVVIYPPVDTLHILQHTSHIQKKENYFLIVSRLVGAKGLEQAAKSFRHQSKYKLKIVGEAIGYSNFPEKLRKIGGGNIELVGHVSDDNLYDLYAKAKGFIALAKEEDFGMTVVESMAAGTPVIAFNGGGFKETVIDGVTGLLIEKTDEKTLKKVIEKFDKINWDRKVIQNHARKFSKERFKKEMLRFIKKYA